MFFLFLLKIFFFFYIHIYIYKYIYIYIDTYFFISIYSVKQTVWNRHCCCFKSRVALNDYLFAGFVRFSRRLCGNVFVFSISEFSLRLSHESFNE